MSDIDNHYSKSVCDRGKLLEASRKSPTGRVINYATYFEKKRKEKIAKATLLRASKLNW